MIYEVEVSGNTTVWKHNGRIHREGGPAVEYANGGTSWYKDGVLHRDDGPAVEFADGSVVWYIAGRPMSQHQFNQLKDQQVVEMTMGQICALVGKQVKVIK